MDRLVLHVADAVVVVTAFVHGIIVRRVLLLAGSYLDQAFVDTHLRLLDCVRARRQFLVKSCASRDETTGNIRL